VTIGRANAHRPQTIERVLYGILADRLVDDGGAYHNSDTLDPDHNGAGRHRPGVRDAAPVPGQEGPTPASA